MYDNSLNFLLIGLVALLAILGTANAHKCYVCSSTCLNVHNGDAEKVETLNKDMCSPECNAIVGADQEQSECDSIHNSCVTVFGLIRKVTDDGLKITLNHTFRGCIPNCPTPMCSLTEMDKCGFEPGLKSDIDRRVGEAQQFLEGTFKGIRSDSSWNSLGQSGELHCCSSQGCNFEKNVVFAHKELKDEL